MVQQATLPANADKIFHSECLYEVSAIRVMAELFNPMEVVSLYQATLKITTYCL